MLRGGNMRFRPATCIWFVFTESFTKMVTFERYKPGLSDCERMISVDHIMNALEHSKVRLPFF